MVENSSRKSLSLSMVVMLAMATAPLSGCSTVKKGWNSTKNAVGGLFGKDDKAPPPADADQPDAQTAEAPATPEPAASTGGLFMSNPNAAKFRSSSDPAPTPAAAPAPEAPAAAPASTEARDGLIADRQKAAYTEQGGRREPVTVRPLNEGAAQVTDGAPPRPQAAPTERVARLEMTPPGQAAPVAAAPAPASPPPPDTTAMAQRLDAPPPSPQEIVPTPAAPPSPATPPPAPARVAGPPTAPTVSAPPPRALIAAAPSSIVDYQDETVVVDSTGVRGGANKPHQQLAGVPRATFDPGNASVSSEVGRISFNPGSSSLSSQAKRTLGDIARLRAQVDGAIRVIGRGDQAAARASAISRELKRLGVPADRLYDGGADNTQLGDEADIYLDY